MSSEQQTTSKSFTYVYVPFLWMTILHPYTWYLTELLGLMILLMDLVLSYSDQYLFVYVGIFSGAVYFLSDFFIVNCTSFSGHSIESSSSKEEDSRVFSCICFSLLISVFVSITGLGIQSFTGDSPEKLKYIDPNVEMTL